MEGHKRTILDALEKSKGIVSKACNAIGLPRRTFYEWFENDPEFKQAVEDCREYVIDLVEDKLHELITEKDTAATIFFLKTQGKKRGYVERTEHAGVPDQPLFGKTDRELQQLINEQQRIITTAEAGSNDTGNTSPAGTIEEESQD